MTNDFFDFFQEFFRFFIKIHTNRFKILENVYLRLLRFFRRLWLTGKRILWFGRRTFQKNLNLMSHTWNIGLKFLSWILFIVLRWMMQFLSFFRKLLFWRFQIVDRHNSSIKLFSGKIIPKIKNPTWVRTNFKISLISEHSNSLKKASTFYEI